MALQQPTKALVSVATSHRGGAMRRISFRRWRGLRVVWDAPFGPPQQSAMETMVCLAARGVGFLSVGRIQDAYFFGLKAGDGNNVVACFSVVGGTVAFRKPRRRCGLASLLRSGVGCPAHVTAISSVATRRLCCAACGRDGHSKEDDF